MKPGQLERGEYVVTIESIERMASSKHGNPRFRLRFTDGSHAATEPNAGLAYGIENPEYRQGPIRITVDGRHNVTRVEVLTH